MRRWRPRRAGGALLAAIIVVTTITGEGSYATWLLTMIDLLGAVAAGAILGVARLAQL